MEIKPRIVPLIAFVSLVFLLHELHDWAHTMAAGGQCHCWAPRSFDSWTLCPNCILDGRQRLLIWLVGPLITYVAIWIGYGLMDPENTLEKRSVGFSLVFAALPLPRIMAVLAGGSDETSAMRQLLEPLDLKHHHLVSLIGLLVVLALTLPALIRAFLMLPGWKGQAAGLSRLPDPARSDRSLGRPYRDEQIERYGCVEPSGHHRSAFAGAGLAFFVLRAYSCSAARACRRCWTITMIL